MRRTAGPLTLSAGVGMAGGEIRNKSAVRKPPSYNEIGLVKIGYDLNLTIDYVTNI